MYRANSRSPIRSRTAWSICGTTSFHQNASARRQEVLGVPGEILGCLHVLQGGQLRVVPGHDRGEDGLPRCPVPHPVRFWRGPRHGPGSGLVAPPEQFPGLLEGLAGEGFPLGPVWAAPGPPAR